MIPAFSWTEPLVSTLFLVLLHSLWQATAVAVGLMFVLAMLRGHSARLRYIVAVGALALTAAAPVATWITVAPSPAIQQSVAPQFDSVTLAAAAASLAEQPVAQPNSAWTTAQRWTVTVWLAGVVLMLLRLSLGWWFIVRLKQSGSPISAEWNRQAGDIAQRLGLRKLPPVLLSQRVAEAMVVGVLRPVILLPASWVLELPPETLRNVLAHELAHVRRWDPLVNGLQRGVEALLFYHPGVWWMSRVIRDERELCCDALAVQVTGQPVAYARTLELVGRRQLGLRTPAWATGMGDRQMKLLKRVRHVLQSDTDPRASGWLPSMLTVAVVLTGIAVYQTTLDQPSAAFADDVFEGDRETRPERDRDRDRPEARKREGRRRRPPEAERRVDEMQREMAELRMQLARERRRNEELQRALRGRSPDSPIDGVLRRPERDVPREQDDDLKQPDADRPGPEPGCPPVDGPDGIPFLVETSRDNVRTIVEPIAERLDECRFYPMVGPARLHHSQYKCTITFDETRRSHWPVPYTFTEQVEEVVYFDKNRLIRCAGPVTK